MMNPRFMLGWLLCALLPLRAAADAPPGRYTVSNGTVYDTRTKLTWQQTVDVTGYTFADAATHCATLPLDGGGWRLPKASELRTIVDVMNYMPAIDPVAFPATPLGYFWTSTMDLHVGVGATYAFTVGTYKGELSSSNTGGGNTESVRCVR
jgi:hypothetical protein